MYVTDYFANHKFINFAIPKLLQCNYTLLHKQVEVRYYIVYVSSPWDCSKRFTPLFKNSKTPEL